MAEKKIEALKKLPTLRLGGRVFEASDGLIEALARMIKEELKGLEERGEQEETEAGDGAA